MVVSLCVLTAPALTGKARAEVIRLTFNQFNPPGTTVARVFEQWEKWVEEKSGGRVDIKLHHGGSLLKMKEAYRGVQKGMVDGSLYILNSDDGFKLNSVITLPFMGWPSQRETTRIYQAIRKQFPEIDKEWKGVKLIGAFMMPPTAIHTVKAIVKTPEDLKGLKMNGMELTLVQTIHAAGATPVSLDPSDMYMSLDRGLVQGVLNIFPVLDVFGVLGLLPYHTILGEGGINMTPICNIMNAESFNKLPPDIQKIFEESGEFWANAFETLDAKQQESTMNSCKEKKHTFTYLTSEQIRVWRDLVKYPVHEKWIEENEAKGLPGKAIYNAASKLLEQHNRK